LISFLARPYPLRPDEGVVRQFPAVNQSQEAAGNDAVHALQARNNSFRICDIWRHLAWTAEGGQIGAVEWGTSAKAANRSSGPIWVPPPSLRSKRGKLF